MEYIIEHHTYGGRYSKEEVQKLLDEKKINIDTRIWFEAWNEWKTIQETDFDSSNAAFEEGAPLPDNLFLSAKKFINYLDKGSIFREPISWLYALLAYGNLAVPLYLLYEAYDNYIFDQPTQYILIFIITWSIIAFASWISFQLWWDRKAKVVSIIKNNEYKATPVYAHFIKTLGEWAGSWITVVGFSVTLLTSLLLWGKGYISATEFGEGLLKAILMPIGGLLIIVVTRFLSELYTAIISIAINTKK